MPLDNVTRLCRAKSKRSGKPCRNPAVKYSQRCRMHGAHSLKGMFHPNYKHGFYSTHWLEVLKVNYFLEWCYREQRKELLVSIYQEELEKLEAEKGRRLTYKEMDVTGDRVKMEFRRKFDSRNRKKTESISPVSDLVE
jgi:hypothetical protein